MYCHVLQVLAASMGAAADDLLHSDAAPFAHHVSRHFGMLYAANPPPPPPAPAMARCTGPGPEPAPPQPGGGGEEDQGWLPRGLRELDLGVYLDALVEVLCDKVGGGRDGCGS